MGSLIRRRGSLALAMGSEGRDRRLPVTLRHFDVAGAVIG